MIYFEDVSFRVATAQGKRRIWMLIFPDRENTGNLSKNIKSGRFYTGKNWIKKKFNLTSLDTIIHFKILSQFTPNCHLYHFYRPQTNLRKGNVFTPACQSFCSRGGVYPSMQWADTPLGRHPPGRHPPPGRYPCTQCILGCTPPAQCMLGYTPWRPLQQMVCILSCFIILIQKHSPKCGVNITNYLISSTDLESTSKFTLE